MEDIVEKNKKIKLYANEEVKDVEIRIRKKGTYSLAIVNINENINNKSSIFYVPQGEYKYDKNKIKLM